jgi:aminoglycoside phosphotransferase (APT) family kinase protein
MTDTTIKDFPARLEAFLAETVGGRVHLAGMRQLTGGASRDTWAIDLEVLSGAQAGSYPLILRRDLGGEILGAALGRDGEFAVLKRAFDAGAHVPRPRWLCMDVSVLGSAFFLMDRLTGESVGRRIVREPNLAMARAALPAQMGEQLARIHALSFEELSFLPRPKPGMSPAQAALEQTRLQLHQLGEPHPALELAIRWLSPRLPACEQPVLVHGDFRVGNLMVGPAGLVGVFDWEFAHVGDAHEDLAWPCVRSWRSGQDDLRLGGVGQPEEFFAAYEKSSGRKVALPAVRVWEILGNLRWAVGCIAQAHRHLSGQAPSVEFASLGRRTCEMELELLELIDKESAA